MVTKLAVKNTLATPSRARRSLTNGSSGSDPLTYVPGPPTAVPTVNLKALGFGVLSARMGMVDVRVTR